MANIRFQGCQTITSARVDQEFAVLVAPLGELRGCDIDSSQGIHGHTPGRPPPRYSRFDDTHARTAYQPDASPSERRAKFTFVGSYS